MTLKELCEAIEAGYAAGKTMFDDSMVGLAQDLCDRTGKIVRALELLSELYDYAESATLDEDPLPPCAVEANDLLASHG